MPTYFLTVFSLKKWAVKRIDKIRRGFLWKGADCANGGHCLVNWNTVKRPKNLGGLGVLDLDLFSRALRQRWLWYEWTDPARPWTGMEVPCNEVDKQFFRASTCVTIGNGRRAKFWESAWLDGRAPRDIAPNLYKLAWRKNLTVCEELQNGNWTRGLWRMTTADEMVELVVLGNRLLEIQLNDQKDAIRSRWTADGKFTARSAHRPQFIGSYSTFDNTTIWQAKVEGKHHFFFHGCWCSARYYPLTNFWRGTGPVMRCVHCVIKCMKWLLISFCTVFMRKKYGYKCHRQQKACCRSLYLRSHWRPGGTHLSKGEEKSSSSE